MITHDLGVIAETCDEVAVFYAGQVVEQASAVDLFHRTAHAYTLGLLRAGGSLGGPSMGGPKRELYAIPGMVPQGGAWSEGCRFAERCGQKMDKCEKAMPALTEIAPGHWCRCFLHGDAAER
jgi:peptide/nickel transport system ATP-binding protein